ncbi:helix-turn-helix domain-containing protein [Mesorhizobium sp. NZP2234]|nr:helix-turn-helix domain-containing protein [Mesorhizobium sp. NZP2234]
MLIRFEYGQVYPGGYVKDDRTYSTDEAAKKLGISKSTLLRWFREKRISDVKRDRNGWRVFTLADIESVKKVL